MPALVHLDWIPKEPGETPPVGHAPAIYRGEPYSLTFTFPVGFDTSGTWSAQVRPTRLDNGTTPAPTATFTCTVNGQDVEVVMPAAQTLLLSTAKAVWDLQQTVSGEPETWFTGNVKAWGDVTR